MKVRFVGFELKVEGRPALPDILARLRTDGGADMRQQDRVVLLDSAYDEYFHRGVVLKIKDQRRFVKLQQEQHTFRIRVETLDEASRLMEFNFFILHKAAGLGVYLYHHGSTTLNTFFQLIRQARYRLVDELKHRLAEQQPPASPQAIRDATQGKLDTGIIVRKQKIEELLEGFDSIGSLELQLTVPDVKGGLFQPLEPYLKRETVRFLFDRKHRAASVAYAVAACIGSDNVRAGKVVALDDKGDEHILKLMNNPDYLDEVEFDDFTHRIITADIARFYEAPAFADLAASYDKLQQIVA